MKARGRAEGPVAAGERVAQFAGHALAAEVLVRVTPSGSRM